MIFIVYLSMILVAESSVSLGWVLGAEGTWMGGDDEDEEEELEAEGLACDSIEARGGI
jgi:hypothetical protein